MVGVEALVLHAATEVSTRGLHRAAVLVASVATIEEDELSSQGVRCGQVGPLCVLVGGDTKVRRLALLGNSLQILHLV